MSSISMDIIIVNYRSNDIVQSCLDSIRACYQQTQPISISVHIVSDGESPTLVDSFSYFPFSVYCLMPEQRLGFGSCCNIGVANGQAEYVLLLNSDTLLTPNFFCELSGYLKEQEGSLSVGFELRSLDGAVVTVRHRKFPTRYSLFLTLFGKKYSSKMDRQEKQVYSGERDGEVDQVMGAVWLIDRKSYEKVGGFDTRFFVYYEDVDLALRLRNAGVPSRYSKVVSVMHAENGTSSRFPAESLAFNVEGRVIYSAIHFSTFFSIVLVFGAVFIEYPLRAINAVLIKKSWSTLLTNFLSMGLMVIRLPRTYIRIFRKS